MGVKGREGEVRKDGGGRGESKLLKGRVFYRWESSHHGGIREAGDRLSKDPIPYIWVLSSILVRRGGLHFSVCMLGSTSLSSFSCDLLTPSGMKKWLP